MAADLQFRIGAELTEIKGALAALRKDFATVGQAAQQAGTNQAFSGLERSARGAIGTVGRLVAGFVTLAGAVRLIGAADELNTLNARIRLVTASTEEYNRAQVALFELAQRTRSSLGETINLYSRIAQATKEAGVGQEVLLQVVETVNQAVQLSGSSAQAAEAALIQLGQGLASGTLRGEELNSVLEQTPALADAIAKGMGITRGELRKYGEEGKITAEQVIKALQAQRDEVAKQFAELPLTVGQSVTLLRNAGLQLVGAFDQASGATSGLASVIKDLADALSDDRLIADAAEFASAWGDAVDLFVQDVRAAVEIFQSATSDISLLGNDLAKDLGLTFTSIPIQVRTFARVVGVEIAAFFDKVLAYGTFVKDNFKAIFTSDTQEASFARFQRRLDAIRTAAGELNDDTFAERDRVLADAANRRDTVLETRRLARRQRPDGFSPGTFKPAADKEAARKAEAQRKAQLDAEEKLLRDSSQRQVTILQELYEDAKISTEAYYARRRELELAALDQAIAVERQRAGAGGVERVKALAEIELLERQKGDVQRRIQREQAAAARELEQQLAQARAQELENQGRTADAERIRLEAQFRDLLRRLEAEGNAAGVRLIRGLIDTGVAKARFDELRAQAERFIADLERKRAGIERRVNSGEITPEQGRAEGDTATAAALASLGPINAQVQQLAASMKDPALLEAANQLGDAIARIGDKSVTGLEGSIADLRISLDQLQQGFTKAAVNAGVDALTNFFNDLASGTKSAGEAIRDFVRGFAASMAALAARVLATVIVLKALEAVTGIPASTLAALGQVGANVKHSGGMAGTGPTRQVPALAFAGAPRFHSGGMVGLKPGEVPAILQTGEEVLSRADPRNAANGGASGGGTRIINVIDPALVQDYMTSSAGERTILNVIERNAGAVRQKLA